MLKIIDIKLSTKIITDKCVGAFNQLTVIPQSSYKYNQSLWRASYSALLTSLVRWHHRHL